MSGRGRPTDPELIALGRSIRRLRQARHLTIEAVAFKAGMSAGHLGRIERGHGNPKWDTLCALASALDVSLSALLRPDPSEEAMLARHGERRLTPEEFERHFGQLPADGEG